MEVISCLSLHEKKTKTNKQNKTRYPIKELKKNMEERNVDIPLRNNHRIFQQNQDTFAEIKIGCRKRDAWFKYFILDQIKHVYR